MNVRNKILIFVGIVSAMIGSIIYFIILPTIEDIETISNTVYLERVDLEKKYLRGQLLKKTIEDFEKMKPEQNKLTSICIIENKELDFITALETVAAQRNLDQDLQLQPLQISNGEDGVYPLKLGIKTQGSFINILKYVKDLEKLPYYFNISSVDIIAASKDYQQYNAITIMLKGDVYALAAQKEE